MVRLTDRVGMLFDGKNFAVLSTPRAGTVGRIRRWSGFKRDGDDLLFALPKRQPQDRQSAAGIRGPLW